MFIADRLVYLQLQKTANSHIALLLEDLIPGRVHGRHNRFDHYEAFKDRCIVGSIRNPWDWYVSLWAYCCEKKGDWYANTTSPRLRAAKLRYHLRLATKGEYGSGPLPHKALRSLCCNLIKPIGLWRHLFSDARDPRLFRAFLTTILGPRKYDFCDGYGLSPASGSAGLMTFYYLKLHSREAWPLYVDSRLAHIDALRRFDRENNVLNCVIRMEHLEDDLLRALETAGYRLTAEQQAAIRAGQNEKFNQSEHLAPVFYYDRETIELVRRRDCLLVEKYGYEGPSAS